ncbi:branched-chain amino acid ABC transporter permease [Sneathiella glossodoripedis]|uniref:branched-chain amino acid ABC transporter permease n=1 Tax=Sneathiella glossodoripedis TaxID=418853 RepID=UPI000470EAD0|nr:branched-chain amino acid ABC transporter permease [Sneathiella glossodoripedis]
MKNNLFIIFTFALLAVMPLILSDYWTGQLNYYLIYGLFALSLSLVWGYGGILCFGQAIFFGIGAYVMAVSTKGMLSPVPANFYLGLSLACMAAAAFAALLGSFLFAGKGINGPYLAIITLAIAMVLERLMSNWYALGGYNGLLDIPPINLGLFSYDLEIWDSRPAFYILWSIVFCITLLLGWLVKSDFGSLLIALRTNPERLTYFGFSPLQIKLKVFCLSAAIAGLAGALFVTLDGFASPTLIGFTLSTEVLIWVALGGKELLIAAFLGAIATRLAENWLSELFGDYWLLILGFLFMVSVVLFPKGLIATPIQAFLKRFNSNKNAA